MASIDDGGAPGPPTPASLPAAAPAAGAELALLIGHHFARPELLAEALTHPSALPPLRQGRRRMRRGARPRHYERLEFLGDRVLGLVIADLLWRRFADEPEGDLTRRLTHLVRRSALARVAAAIGVERYLLLSPAEAASGAARNPGILADVVEAVIAAIYLDGGFAASFAFIERFWEPLLADMTAPPRDPKTSLQEWAQARGLPLPDYQLIATSGPDHAPQFTVAVRVAGLAEASAVASSKRAAETGAAAALIERLGDAANG
ncbi:MAG TPA: ribonuclease III [Stellaceae bacterium]|nr:ribonuclease III [Stellaceae bacterium]